MLFRSSVNRPQNEFGARRAAEGLALALEASLMLRYSPPPIADAFCASRLDGDWGRAFGTLPAGVDVDGVVALLDRTM